RHAPWLAGQAALAAELGRSEKCDDGLFPLVGNNGDLDLAFLDIEHGIRRVALREDDLILAIFGYASALADFGEKGFGIERHSSFGRHDTSPRSHGTASDSKCCGVSPARWDRPAAPGLGSLHSPQQFFQ